MRNQRGGGEGTELEKQSTAQHTRIENVMRRRVRICVVQCVRVCVACCLVWLAAHTIVNAVLTGGWACTQTRKRGIATRIEGKCVTDKVCVCVCVLTYVDSLDRDCMRVQIGSSGAVRVRYISLASQFRVHWRRRASQTTQTPCTHTHPSSQLDDSCCMLTLIVSLPFLVLCVDSFASIGGCTALASLTGTVGPLTDTHTQEATRTHTETTQTQQSHTYSSSRHVRSTPFSLPRCRVAHFLLSFRSHECCSAQCACACVGRFRCPHTNTHNTHTHTRHTSIHTTTTTKQQTTKRYILQQHNTVREQRHLGCWVVWGVGSCVSQRRSGGVHSQKRNHREDTAETTSEWRRTPARGHTEVNISVLSHSLVLVCVHVLLLFLQFVWSRHLPPAPPATHRHRRRRRTHTNTNNNNDDTGNDTSVKNNTKRSQHGNGSNAGETIPSSSQHGRYGVRYCRDCTDECI